MISIHALREEGDRSPDFVALADERFQSTPSARRATHFHKIGNRLVVISIHALREEGDYFCVPLSPLRKDFNPRPPRGGRPSVFQPAIAI